MASTPLYRLHRKQHRDTERHNPDPRRLGLLKLDLRLLDDLLQPLDVAAEGVHVVRVVLDRRLQLPVAYVELQLHRRDAGSDLRGQISPQTPADLSERERLQNREGQAPLPQSAQAVPDRPEQCRRDVEAPGKAGPISNEVELALVVRAAGADELSNRGALIVGRLDGPSPAWSIATLLMMSPCLR